LSDSALPLIIATNLLPNSADRAAISGRGAVASKLVTARRPRAAVASRSVRGAGDEAGLPEAVPPGGIHERTTCGHGRIGMIGMSPLHSSAAARLKSRKQLLDHPADQHEGRGDGRRGFPDQHGAVQWTAAGVLHRPPRAGSHG